MTSFLTIIQFLLKLIGLIELAVASAKTYIYNQGIELINKEVNNAKDGPIEERSAAAKRLEDFINKHAS